MGNIKINLNEIAALAGIVLIALAVFGAVALLFYAVYIYAIS
jgi:type IV secretory pathway TrbL component